MDTNINNYNIKEILTLIKLPENDCNLVNLYTIVSNILTQINNSDEINNRNTILMFFRQCFYKVCNGYNFMPTELMKKIIDVHNNISGEINGYNEYNENNSNNDINDSDSMITKDVYYAGSLPLKVPEIVTVGVNQDKYVRGLVNPLKRETIKNILTIHSKFRTDENSTSTDFTVILNDPFNNVVSLKLASMELVNSYYAISDYLKTNKFTVETYIIDNTTNAVTDFYSKEIEISEGGYNAEMLYPILNAIFDSDPKLNMITSIFNSVKGKIIFSLKATTALPAGKSYGFNLLFTISDDPNRAMFLNFGWLLGFTKKKYTFLTDYVPTATTIKEVGFNPDMPLDLSGTKFFLLEVTDFNNNAPAVLKYNIQDRYSFNIKDILAKLPNVSSTYSVIFEDSSDRIFKTRNYFGPVRIQKLKIRLLDENGRLVNLNNSDMVISFEVESLEIPYKNMVK